MNTSENNSVAHESSRVIILKSRLSCTGHSACTREVRDIFDRETRIPIGLMIADVFARSPTLRSPQLNDSARP